MKAFVFVLAIGLLTACQQAPAASQPPAPIVRPITPVPGPLLTGVALITEASATATPLATLPPRSGLSGFPSFAACERTVLSPERNHLYPVFVPIAPSLEWRTSADTIWPRGSLQEIFIRADTQAAPQTVIASAHRRGTADSAVVNATLHRVLPDDPALAEDQGASYYRGQFALPRSGCWDVTIQVNDLEGRVVVQVTGRSGESGRFRQGELQPGATFTPPAAATPD